MRVSVSAKLCYCTMLTLTILQKLVLRGRLDAGPLSLGRSNIPRDRRASADRARRWRPGQREEMLHHLLFDGHLSRRRINGLGLGDEHGSPRAPDHPPATYQSPPVYTRYSHGEGAMYMGVQGTASASDDGISARRTPGQPGHKRGAGSLGHPSSC